MLFIICLLLSACSVRPYMSEKAFNQIHIGESVDILKKAAYQPDNIQSIGQGTTQYIYIERIPINRNRTIFKKYCFTIQGSKIIKKEIVEDAQQIDFHGSL